MTAQEVLSRFIYYLLYMCTMGQDFFLDIYTVLNVCKYLLMTSWTYSIPAIQHFFAQFDRYIYFVSHKSGLIPKVTTITWKRLRLLGDPVDIYISYIQVYSNNDCPRSLVPFYILFTIYVYNGSRLLFRHIYCTERMQVLTHDFLDIQYTCDTTFLRSPNREFAA